MSEQPVLLEKTGGVLFVTLNRPDKKNAMSLALLEDLVAALD